MIPRFTRFSACVSISMLALALLVLVSPGREANAVGMTFVVNQAENLVVQGDGTCDATCTLRDAIIAANANDGADTITFTGDGADQIVYPGPLPAIDASDGITIDGTGADVLIAGFEQQIEPFDGLRFRTAVGTELHNVTIRDLEVQYFTRAIVVCPGFSAGDCTYDATDITLDDLRFANTTGSSIDIRGGNISNISLAHVFICGGYTGAGCVNTASNGIMVKASNDVSSISIENVTVTNVGAETRAIHVDGGSVDGVSLSGVQVLGPNGRIEIHAAGSYSNISASGITSEAAGIYIFGEGAGNNISVVDSHFELRSGGGVPPIAVGDHGTSLNNVSVMRNVTEGIGDYQGGIGILGLAMMSNVTVADNQITGGSIFMLSDVTQSTTIEGNTVNDNSNPVSGAIWINSKSEAGLTVVRNNALSGNEGDGIKVGFEGYTGDRVTISRNSTYNNMGLGIKIYAPVVSPPSIDGGGGQQVTGMSCANCKIELFLSDNDPSGYGEGQQFLRDATANGTGSFAVSICGLNLLAGTKVTATATDPAGKTSEFSLNYALTTPSGTCPTPTPSPTPSPTPTPTPSATPIHSPTPTPTGTGAAELTQGDVDCNGSVTSVDALKELRYVALLSVSQTQPCPIIGTDVASFWGDVDCSGSVSSVDALKVLRYVAALPVAQTEPCWDLGSIVVPV